MIGIFPISEPKRGKLTYEFLNDLVEKNQILNYIVPYTADIFVFAYPVYLVGLYLMGIYYRKEEFKNFALLLFFSAFGTIVVNLLIQSLLYKERPIPEFYRDELILKNIPQNAFPSDHAALSFAIAMSTLLYALQRKNRRLLNIGILLAGISVIMSTSRVALGAHRPTDILMGFAVAYCVSRFLTHRPIYDRCKRKIFKPIISFEKRFWKKYFKIDQGD